MDMRPQPHTGQMDDRLMAVDCLEAGKHLAVEYTIAALESANPQLRRIFTQAAQNNIQASDEMFRFMKQRGWYSPTPAQPQQVQQLAQQFHAPRQPGGRQMPESGARQMPSPDERREPVQGGHYGYGSHAGQGQHGQSGRQRQESPFGRQGQVPTEAGIGGGEGSPRTGY